MSNIFDLFKKIEKPTSTMPVSAIIVGLGNPGREYERTRHNVGFISVDYIAERLGVKIDRAKFHALVAEATVGEKRVLLMKPTTYLNNSGVAVAEAASFYKIPPERVIVLHDNVPNIITQISGALAKDNVNIESLLSQAKGNNAVSIFDSNDNITESVVNDIKAINGVVRVLVR